MIPVTKTYLPPLEEYQAYLKKIWEKGWITNHGVYVNELEEKLKSHLNIKYLRCLSNRTLALQIAIKSLELKGEIITTPFSYVATTDAILWENCTPVYVDIDPETLPIDSTTSERSFISSSPARSTNSAKRSVRATFSIWNCRIASTKAVHCYIDR